MTPLLSLDAGQEQRELGLFATALNNEDFVKKARAVARLICAVSGSVTMDNIRTHPAMHGLQPSSPHCFGAVFNTKEWRLVSFERSTLKSNHTRRIGRWRYEP